MYFTRFRMNPQKRGSVRLAASPQRLHATVLSAFPPDRATSRDGRVLWRLDTPSKHEWTLYVVSPARPSMEQLQDECGWSQEQSWDTAEYGPFLVRLSAGQRWSFRLTANPVRTVAGGRGTRGTVSPHVTVAQQQAWLVERTARLGFQIPSWEVERLAPTRDPGPEEHDIPHVRVTGREQISFEKGGASRRRTATITRAQFDGVLEVVDEELLRSALTHGIGRAKAYGCGLMTLASAP